MSYLRSARAAFVTMAFIVAVLIVLGYQFFGWLGVGVVGLLGLVISFRAEIFENYGDPHERNAHSTVNMYGRQMQNRQFDGDDGYHKRRHRDTRQHTFFRVINAIFLAITMLGGSMYVIRVF